MKILICDDHQLFAEALQVVLSRAGHEVVAVVTTPDAAVAEVARQEVDLCLLDLNFPRGSGVEAAGGIHAARPECRVVALTGSTDPALAASALEAGVLGFVQKSAQVAEVVRAVERVAAGEAIITPRQLSAVLAVRRPPPVSDIARLASYLTAREREVLQRLVRGESTRALSKSMGIRYSTARTHVQSVLTKLGVHTRLEAAALAVRHGLVEP